MKKPENPIAFIDLAAQQKRLGNSIQKSIEAVLSHGRYVMGPEIDELEEKLAKFAGCKYSVSCASGTDALLMSLLVKEVGKGDAVIVPTFTFVATAEAVVLAGATPIFADVCDDTYNMDANSLLKAINVAKEKGLNLKGIITVDLFGLPADYAAISKIAKENNLFLLDDACQGFGASYNGTRMGAVGDLAATSFFPAKPLGCYGDGGAVFCNSEEDLELLKSVRVHGGGSNKYDNVRIGITGRCDSIQAAVLLQKLTIFEDELKARQMVADRYNAALADVVKVPVVPEGCQSAWAQYTIATDNRDGLGEFLMKENGVPSACYYPIPLHQQTAYKHFPRAEETLAISEKVCNKVISLPMHPYMEDDVQDYIIESVKDFYK
ncbi:MAG: DegT/DnrJ/EryC1/StrS family aminotransferase [Alphaproteobacteria bacterium]|nr:DegT/DnrJ/EryC1/StrS family aminotransferase [Alphaproteobacteria bacterium]